MKKIETGIPGLVVIEPVVFGDDRGYFFECWSQQKFHDLGIETQFVQDNESMSSKGVIRGLHYQLAPHAQSKLVRVIRGSVYDVAVDIRKNSPTFGKWFGIELSETNKRQMFIPKGFAHGFSVLENNTIFYYKCDDFYNKDMERGINMNDPFLKIDWKIDAQNANISPKDKILPFLENAEMNFIF